MENYADRSKWTLEDFDLQKAEDGAVVCAKDGYVYEFIKNEGKHTALVFSQLVYDTRLSEGLKPQKSNGYVEKSKYDLFHPVPIKEVKKKRIEFDASRVGEEGIEVVCRHNDGSDFVSVLKTDLKHNKSIVCVFVDKLGVEFITRHYPNGRIHSDGEHSFDLFLLVPDTEPVLPSMQEVAEKIQGECLWAMETGITTFSMRGIQPYMVAETDVDRLKCIGLLMNVARFVNDGWDTKGEAYYFEAFMDGVICVPLTSDPVGQIFFKSEEAAYYAREILNSWEPGDAILKRALGVQ